jgi:hypothetical protein
MNQTSSKRPILFVDVDGVISLFGFSSSDPPPGSFHFVDGVMHCINEACGPRLTRLSERYELVWATGWEERANDSLAPLLGLPELPYLSFDGAARFGSAHWKLGPLDKYAGDRPLAWVDDSFDESCFDWARDRAAPTLLVPTESPYGLEEAQAEALTRWASELPVP